MYFDPDDLPRELTGITVGDLLQNYVEMKQIIEATNIKAIIDQLEGYRTFIGELTKIRDKWHLPETIELWEPNEPQILREVWEATKKLVPWDGVVRKPTCSSILGSLLAQTYIPHLQELVESESLLSKMFNEKGNEKNGKSKRISFNTGFSSGGSETKD